MTTKIEESIRRDERRRLATMFEAHAETLCVFTGEGGSRATLGLVILLLRLGLTEDVLSGIEADG